MQAASADPAAARLRIHPVLRYAAPAVYVVALLAVCVVRGIPASRDAVFLWVLLGLACVVAGTGRGTIRGILVDWLPLAVVLFAYDVLRGYADSFLTAHVTPQLDFDRWLFGGTVPTVWLQERLWHGASAIDWIDWASWLVYLTHFFATLTVAAGLWLLRRPLYRPYAAMVSVLALMGFATYALFPAVPPWMASRDGALEPTERIVQDISKAAPVDFFGAIWEHGARYANDVAAMPSLHAGYALLITLYLWPYVGRRWRPVLAAYPLAMGFALVYTAEHYVSDVLAGWLYAAVAFAGVTLVVTRRRQPHG
jgi:membrane-associated phospholipid phosphatase